MAFKRAENETYLWDTDGSIQYSDGWELTEITHDETGQDGTFHSTTKVGSKAALSFYGSQIVVNGYVFPGDSPVSAYFSVDSGDASYREEPTNIGGQTYLSTNLFQSDPLPLARHIITVEVANATAARNFCINFFLVNSNDQGILASSTSSSIQSSATASGTPASGQNSTEGQSSSDGGSKGVSVGAVIGAVFAGIVLGAILAGIFPLYRNYKRRKNRGLLTVDSSEPFPTRDVTQQSGGATDGYGAVHPFTLGQAGSQQSTMSENPFQKIAGTGFVSSRNHHVPVSPTTELLSSPTLSPDALSNTPLTRSLHPLSGVVASHEFPILIPSSTYNDCDNSGDPPAYHNRASRAE
ncbi:uncharacterized protein FOMMEDRAFT_160829 [Fomitiporia mediterranea MF3/22]|uniref:uncharacterized protein n=1 Tax=Fomitiporia mediterranea (strain MF3/22) TaxID=694068 RepID=UPI0004408CF6|nr:uncharacterized protein FOMMEDRAFT_160829 [Fomitiporia mediterranea MF3/22]EJC99235.1 hypothetical protein FOMMEDRAFT_160829 [Fomitiporia mediterranea MF3/22]